MKKALLFLLLLCGVTTLHAERRSSFRFGLNYPISFAKHAAEESAVGVTLGWERRMNKSPWAWGVNGSFEAYAKYLNEPDKGIYYLYPHSFRTLTLAPYVNYYFAESNVLSSFVGMSVGGAIDSRSRSVLKGEANLIPVLAPRCGVTLFKHVEVALQYYFACDFRSHAIFSLSYKF